MTANEVADVLRDRFRGIDPEVAGYDLADLLDDALAAEHRNTVESIRGRLGLPHRPVHQMDSELVCIQCPGRDVDAILLDWPEWSARP